MSIRSEQDAILQVMGSAQTPQLEALLDGIDLDRLFTAFAGCLGRDDRRAELAQVLCTDRVGEATPGHLARVVHAMRSLRRREDFSRAIRDVFDALGGEDFRDFKYRLNATGDRHDLEHVVFERLLPEDRAAVLARIRDEAAGAPAVELRVLSDIDDTVIAMLHDSRYDRGTVVPGAVQFLSELDDGAAAKPDRAGDLTFVTARPSGPRGLIEQYTRDGLSHLGLPPHSVLGGSFLNLATKASIAARKLQNFEHERDLFPECRLVFVGDSGQADPQVGSEMLRRDPGFVARVFIHDVTGMSALDRRRMEASGITVFKTYSGAARAAVQAGFISDAGATRVHEAVIEGFEGDGVRDPAAMRATAVDEFSAS